MIDVAGVFVNTLVLDDKPVPLINTHLQLLHRRFTQRPVSHPITLDRRLIFRKVFGGLVQSRGALEFLSRLEAHAILVI